MGRRLGGGVGMAALGGGGGEDGGVGAGVRVGVSMMTAKVCVCPRKIGILCDVVVVVGWCVH